MMMPVNWATNQRAPAVQMRAGQSGLWHYKVNQLSHTGLLMMLTFCAESAPCQRCLTFILTDYTAFTERLNGSDWV